MQHILLFCIMLSILSSFCQAIHQNLCCIIQSILSDQWAVGQCVYVQLTMCGVGCESFELCFECVPGGSHAARVAPEQRREGSAGFHDYAVHFPRDCVIPKRDHRTDFDISPFAVEFFGACQPIKNVTAASLVQHASDGPQENDGATGQAPREHLNEQIRDLVQIPILNSDTF